MESIMLQTQHYWIASLTLAMTAYQTPQRVRGWSYPRAVSSDAVIFARGGEGGDGGNESEASEMAVAYGFPPAAFVFPLVAHAGEFHTRRVEISQRVTLF